LIIGLDNCRFYLSAITPIRLIAEVRLDPDIEGIFDVLGEVEVILPKFVAILVEVKNSLGHHEHIPV